MRCAVIFGTVEGQTRKIAEVVAESLQDAGHEVVMSDVSEKGQDLALAESNLALIAAPVHQQRHPDDIINFAKANADQLNEMASALISVSMSAALPDGEAEARSYVDRLLSTTGWQPRATHLAAGALRYTEYDFFQEQIIRHIVLKGHDLDDIKGDHVFTDWDALKRFVDQLIAK